MAEETGTPAPQDEPVARPPAETHQLPPETITAGGKEWASIDELVKGYEHAQLKISEQGGELGKLRKEKPEDDDTLAPLDDSKPPTHTPFVELMFDDAEGAEAALAERIAEKVLAQTSNCKLSPEEKKELAEAIAQALRKEFYIVPYSGQLTFE